MSSLSNYSLASETTEKGNILPRQSQRASSTPGPIVAGDLTAAENEFYEKLVTDLFARNMAWSEYIEYVLKQLSPSMSNSELKKLETTLLRRALSLRMQSPLKILGGGGVGDHFQETYQIVEPYIAVATDAMPYAQVPACKSRITATEQIILHNMIWHTVNKFVEDFDAYVQASKNARSHKESALYRDEVREQLVQKCGDSAVEELDNSLAKHFTDAEIESMELPINHEELELEERRERFRMSCLALLWKSSSTRSPAITFVSEKIGAPISSVSSSAFLAAILSRARFSGSAFEPTAVGAAVPSSYRAVCDGRVQSSSFALFKQMMTASGVSSAEQILLFNMLCSVADKLSEKFGAYVKVSLLNHSTAESVRDFTKCRQFLVDASGESVVEEVDQLIRSHRSELNSN